jgi:hypothetical protein
VLDVFFSLDGGNRGPVLLEIDEHFDPVSLRESFYQSLSVLENPTNEIVGYAYMERSAGAACQNVNPEHHSKRMDCRVKPGNDSEIGAPS